MADQPVDLATYLMELEADRAKLDVLIAGIRGRLGLGAENGNAPSPSPAMPQRDSGVPGRVRPDEFFRMSIPESIRRYLEIMKAPQAPTAIVSALKAGGVLSESKNFYTTVWTAIKRGKASGELVNTKTGWALSEWYPNRPKAPDDDSGARSGKKRRKGAQRAKKPSRQGKSAKKREKPAAGQDAQATAQPSGGEGKRTNYNTFMSQEMKAGKTMKQAAEAWRKQKGAA